MALLLAMLLIVEPVALILPKGSYCSNFANGQIATSENWFTIGNYTVFLREMALDTSVGTNRNSSNFQAEMEVDVLNYALPNQAVIGLFSDPPPSRVVSRGCNWQLFYIFNMSANSPSYVRLYLISKVYDVSYNPPVQDYVYDTNSDLYRTYTASEPVIQADDKFIKDQARVLAHDDENPLTVAKDIFDYLRNHIAYGFGEEDALSVLRSNVGSCSGQSNAYVALLRAAGIPSRVVSGITLVGFHAYAEFYLPNLGWIPVDPTWGQFAYKNAHLDIGYQTMVNDEEMNNTYPLATATYQNNTIRYYTSVSQGIIARNITLADENSILGSISHSYSMNFGNYYLHSTSGEATEGRSYDSGAVLERDLLWDPQHIPPLIPDSNFAVTKDYLEETIENNVRSAYRIITNSNSTNYNYAVSLAKNASDLLHQGQLLTASIQAVNALSLSSGLTLERNPNPTSTLTPTSPTPASSFIPTTSNLNRQTEAPTPQVTKSTSPTPSFSNTQSVQSIDLVYLVAVGALIVLSIASTLVLRKRIK